jgi:hypothetical protein
MNNLYPNFDPNVNTGTTFAFNGDSVLTAYTKQSAIGEWQSIYSNSQQIYYHLHRVSTESENWSPKKENPYGRWVGLVKPENKEHAIKLYALESWRADIDKPWLLYTFKITKSGLILESDTRGGNASQYKITNDVIEYIEILKTEEIAKE